VNGQDVAAVQVADTYLARLRGLLGRRGTDGALLLSSCTSVHAAGMAFTLDVALLDADLTVLRTTRLRPFGLVLPRPGVVHILEAEHGAFGRWGLFPGVRLTIDPPVVLKP
jgi:uncharacterized membrane protein (UPF0127 family)